MLINASGRPVSIEDIPLEDIEAAFEGASDQMDGCSTMSTPVPPLSAYPNPFFSRERYASKPKTLSTVIGRECLLLVFAGIAVCLGAFQRTGNALF